MISTRLSIAALAVFLVPFSASSLTVRLDRTDVQVVAAGAARCEITSKADNSAVAAATSSQRQAGGLAPVRANAKLAKAAAAHACDMARRGVMAHHGSSTKGPAQRVKAIGYRPAITAENIAAGPFSLGQVLSIWNQSPGHQSNIMLPNIREVGIGRAVGSDGKTVFWAAVYSAPR